MTTSGQPDQDLQELKTATYGGDMSSAAPLSLLRETLPGEYLSLALIVHSAFGSLLWAACSLDVPAGLLLVAAGIWVMIRASGAFAQRSLTTLVTTGLMIATLAWKQHVDLAAQHLWFFSPSVFVVMLGIVLCSDIADFLASPWGTQIRNRLRVWNWHRLAIWAFVSAFAVYMVVIPTASYFVESMKPTESISAYREKMSLGEMVRLRSMEAMTALVFFGFGATIGSFLNVVVFRMPRGESVVFHASRCPRCETPIKGHDNVPIFGWLLLNGRCRACQIAISSRYPIVETVCAAIFLLFYFVELISGGANIPIRKPNFYHGVVWVIFYTKWDLIAIYLFHCFTLSTLLTWALIDIDRQRIPWWARCVAAGILLVLPVMMPDLLPVPWQAREYGFDENWQSVLQTAAIGGACGAVLGWLVWLSNRTLFLHREHGGEDPDTELSSQSGHIISASIIVGISVGWQAVMGVTLIALAIWPIAVWLTKRWNVPRPPATMALLLAYIIHLAFWRRLNVVWWPSIEATLITWIFWSAGFVALYIADRLVVGASTKSLPNEGLFQPTMDPIETTRQ